MQSDDFRSSVLISLGAAPAVIDELLAYNKNVFNHDRPSATEEFPLADESFVAAWRRYVAEAEAESVGAFAALLPRLPQLQFPVQTGISESPAHRRATKKGQSTSGVPAGGLLLAHPDRLQLTLHQSLAGAIPVLVPAGRADFVALVCALTARNEPIPIPESMGAAMVSGYNNWDRVNQLKREWQQENPGGRWSRHFREQVVPNKPLYQDRFIILSDGPYSGVTAESLGVSDEEWIRLSLSIRLEHECTHYFTRRLFGSMRNNLWDELIADYRGVALSVGRYRADWFLRFLGLENFPDYRAGGRLENYRGDPPLSDEAFRILAALVVDAARNLERIDQRHADQLSQPRQQAGFLIALTRLSLEELASVESDELLDLL